MGKGSSMDSMGKGSSMDSVMGHRGMDSMMGNNRGVDSMSNRSMDGMSNGSSMNGLGNRGMGNNWSMDSMGNNWSMDSMGNRGMDGVGNNRGMDSMGNNRSMDGMGNRGMDSMSCRIAGSSLIGDLSNESKVVVSMVGGGLNSAIRKSNGVGSSNVSIVILGFSLSEVGSTVVISYSILVGEGLRGLLVGLGGVGGGREGSSSSHKSRGKDDLKKINY